MLKSGLIALPTRRAVTRALPLLSRASHSHSHGHTSSSDDELEHFNELAKTWWDVGGSQRILHKMNLLRMDFIQQTLRENVRIPDDSDIFVPGFSLDLLPKDVATQIVAEQDSYRDAELRSEKFKALDIGCGGGILTESLARLPFVESVKAIDLSPGVLEAANAHKALDPLINDKITYKLQPVEDEKSQYDIVTMMEMLEHVDYPAEVLLSAMNRVRPGGWLFLSTINRDLISYFTTILVAEHLLRIVPVGTHTYDKYINSAELVDWVERRPGFEVTSVKGCMYLPLKGWVFCGDGTTGNYMAAVRRL